MHDAVANAQSKAGSRNVVMGSTALFVQRDGAAVQCLQRSRIAAVDLRETRDLRSRQLDRSREYQPRDSLTAGRRGERSGELIVGASGRQQAGGVDGDLPGRHLFL